MRSRAMLLVAASLVDCTDPVRERQIADLGEDPAPPGPEHRPGQPCVLCHSEGGPAADAPFAVAGTIYEQPTGSKGASEVTVELVDTNGISPRVKPITNRAGNFWVTSAEWPDLAYPFKVRVLPRGGRPIEMTTAVNREGSCSACHAKVEGADQARRSVGPIFVGESP